MPAHDRDRHDEDEEQGAVVQVQVPPARHRLGGPRRAGGVGRLGGGQVGEQPAEVLVGLGFHGLVEALVELRLVQPPVPVVPGQQVGHLGALGVGDPEVGVAGTAAGGGQEPGRAARRGHGDDLPGQRERVVTDWMRSLAMDCSAPSSGISSQPAR
jgi:hypothetical protein